MTRNRCANWHCKYTSDDGCFIIRKLCSNFFFHSPRAKFFFSFFLMEMKLQKRMIAIRFDAAPTSSNNFYLSQMYSMFYWKFDVIFGILTSNKSLRFVTLSMISTAFFLSVRIEALLILNTFYLYIYILLAFNCVRNFFSFTWGVLRNFFHLSMT